MKIYIKSAIADPLNEDYDAQWEISQTSDDPEMLNHMAQSSDEQLVYQVLKNPNASPELLKSIVDTDPHSYKYNWRNAELAMENPSMPLEVLQDIDRYPHLLNSIAINPSTPRSVLERLIKRGKDSHNYDLLGCIAVNANAPEQYLLEVANGNSLPDKMRLARNPAISYEVQKQLYSLNDEWIDQNLAVNSGVSEDILQKILTYSRNSLTLSLAEHNLRNRHN